jgi:hypothetical protein
MTNENYFYEELARVPELPPHLYTGIRRNIRRHTLFIRTAVSLAATLLLTIGITAMFVPGRSSAVAISPEVASELLSIREFGSGSDISKDIETYAFYDGDLSN